MGHTPSGVALHRTRQAGAERLHRIVQQQTARRMLERYVFTTLAEARAIIEAWREDYNQQRPHSSLGALTPSEFAALKRNQTNTAPGGRNNRRSLLINGGKMGGRPESYNGPRTRPGNTKLPGPAQPCLRAE